MITMLALLGVGLVEVDLVVHAVEAERHRLHRVAAVEVVDEDHIHALRHLLRLSKWTEVTPAVMTED